MLFRSELAGAALAGQIDAALAAPPPAPGLARLVRMLGMTSNEAARPVLRRVLEHAESAESAESAEATAAALDALWHPDDAHWARSGAVHAQWFVRVAAAKALARLGVAEDCRPLTVLLSDTSWWVRYRAAQALARLPGMTREELLRMRESAGDRYAADMLGQVISEQAAP